MTPEQFAYWLQGYAELTHGFVPNADQWKSIKDHLSTVFHKVTPPVSVDNKITLDPSKWVTTQPLPLPGSFPLGGVTVTC